MPSQNAGKPPKTQIAKKKSGAQSEQKQGKGSGELRITDGAGEQVERIGYVRQTTGLSETDPIQFHPNAIEIA